MVSASPSAASGAASVSASISEATDPSPPLTATERDVAAQHRRQPRGIIITGASSGIGEALARRYAAKGVALALTGRDGVRLQTVAEACAAAGAKVFAATLDVCDATLMASWLQRVDAVAPMDLIIANAGISAGTGGSCEPTTQARRILETNLLGALNTIEPLLPAMRARRHGQIALISSLAAFRGLPTAPAYSASKGGLRLYGEGLRGSLRPYGISVSVICPGFVVSRITEANDFPMPFLMAADKAAERICRGLARNQGRIAFPRLIYLGAWLSGVLPPSWTERMVARLPDKKQATKQDKNENSA